MDLTHSPTATSIDGVHLFSTVQHRDSRGWFGRTLDLEWLAALGLETNFVHHNQSRSVRGVLRGLHVRGGASEAKLVRCSSGRIVDNVVDLRPWSPTFLHSEQFVLDDVDMRHLYLPPGVAHGFQVLSDHADICYLHSRAYEAGADLSISWNDPDLALDWPLPNPLISPRDAEAPFLRDVDVYTIFERPDEYT